MGMNEEERNQDLEDLAKANKYADVLIQQIGQNMNEFVMGADNPGDRRIRIQMAFHSLGCLAEVFRYNCHKVKVAMATISKIEADGMKRAAGMLEEEILQAQIASGNKGGIIQ